MADIRKRNGKNGTTYQVRYPSRATKSGYAYKSFEKLKDAKAFLESGQIPKGRCSGPLSTDIQTVDQAISAWLKICAKEGRDGRDPVTTYTHKIYVYWASIIRSYPWPKRLQEISGPDVVKFRSWLLHNYSRYQAKKSLSVLHSVFSEMVLRGHIEINVVSGVSIQGRSRYDRHVTIPSSADVGALLSAADSLANSKNRQLAKAWERYRPLIYLAVDSGMRPQEYLALAGSSVMDGGVKVERAIERSGKLSVPKTRSAYRFIDLSPEVLDMVRDYRDNKAIKNKYDLVFPTATGRWLSRENFRKACFLPLCREAGLIEIHAKDGRETERPKFRLYDLRHFYASMLIDQNLNLKKIQSLMGHKNISTTFDVYGHLIEKSEDAGKPALGMLARSRLC